MVKDTILCIGPDVGGSTHISGHGWYQGWNDGEYHGVGY